MTTTRTRCAALAVAARRRLRDRAAIAADRAGCCSVHSSSLRARAARKLLERRRRTAQASAARSPASKLRPRKRQKVVKLSRASIKYPASGKLVGDWKAGERLAHDGTAATAPAAAATKRRKENGGLCQNCHALEPRDQRRQRRAEPHALRRARGDVRTCEVHLREDLQRVGVLPLLQHAAPRARTATSRRSRSRTSWPT